MTRFLRSARLRAWRTIVAFGLLAFASAPVRAQIVYAGGPPSGADGHSIADDFRAADDFAFFTATSFNRISFWALLPSGASYTPSMFWEVLADAGGTPGAVVTSGTTVAFPTFRAAAAFGYDSWQYDMDVGSQPFAPGTFWLALHDGALDEVTYSGMLWETSTGSTGADYVEGFGADWAPFSGDLAFELSDQTVTPEPGTLVLLVTGMAGITASRRRRRPDR